MRRSSWLFLGCASTLVGGAIILGLSIIPGPREQRKLSLDEMRLRDLIAMYNAITAYYRANGHLPASPDALPRSPTLRLTDPITDRSYEYIVNDLRNYQVCAVFDTNSTGTMISYPPEAANWKHETGHNCFTLSGPLLPGPR
jgi:hypothetical protein